MNLRHRLKKKELTPQTTKKIPYATDEKKNEPTTQTPKK